MAQSTKRRGPGRPGRPDKADLVKIQLQLRTEIARRLRLMAAATDQPMSDIVDSLLDAHLPPAPKGLPEPAHARR